VTTLRQIITDSLRESGIIQIGLVPDAEEFDEALRKLLNVIDSLFGNELGVPLEPVSYGDNGLSNPYAINEDVSDAIDSSYVPCNTRLMVNINSAKTVYLDPNPKDGSRFAVIDEGGNFATYNFTINGNGRKIEDANSVVVSTNSANKEWFFREDTGNWALVSELTANSQNPFPSEFDDFLITLLAIRLNPRYQVATAPETLEGFRRMRQQFRAKYKQVTEVGSELGLIRFSGRPTLWDQGIVYSDRRFKRGFIY
jgi:hypothetical protein